MRFYEICNLYEQISNELTNIVQKYKNEGWDIIGQGEYGIVLTKSGYDWVLKIFKNDQKYLEYITWVYNNQKNQFVPKIKEQPKKLYPGVYIVEIENLSPLETNDSALEKYIDPKIRTSFFGKKLSINPSTMYNQKNIEFMKKNYPEFLELFNKILEIGNGQLDVTTKNNVMKRANGDVVFTDPVS